MTAPLPTASRWNTFSRSRYPRLWDGCVGAWCPSLGVTGARLHDYGQRMGWATPSAYGATNWAVERGGLAYDFQNGQYADSATIGPTGDKSGCFWVRNYGAVTSLYGGYCALSWGATQSGNAVYINYDNDPNFGGTGWGVTQWGSSIGFVQAIDGIWHHVAVTNSGTAWRVYFDGIEKVSTSYMQTNTQAGFIRIAAYNETPVRNASKGMFMDDIRVYSRALSLDEIRLLATRRAIAYEPEYQPAYYMEPAAGGVTSRPYAYQSARMIGAGR
jgi:hypothetical protein